MREIVELRRRGFRFIALADDNFYPVTFEDLAQAGRRADSSRLSQLQTLREERFELMAQLAQLPDDLVFYTQITMEAAEDGEFLDAMRRAHIRGTLVGVESVTAAGLKDVYKGFNLAGDALVQRLRAFVNTTFTSWGPSSSACRATTVTPLTRPSPLQSGQTSRSRSSCCSRRFRVPSTSRSGPLTMTTVSGRCTVFRSPATG